MKVNYYFIIMLLIFYYLFESNETTEESIRIRSLNNDGFCVLYNQTYAIDTTSYPCQQLTSDVLQKLPDDYIFIDYIYKINHVALSTFHRDVTSSKYIYKTKYPIYTLILYKYDGALLSVCPGSNQTYPFVWSSIVNITGKSGTAFLFDSDLLHAGCLNNCNKRELIQYKLCHKDDLHLLSHLQNVNMNKSEKCTTSYSQNIIRKLSYYFEMPINYILYPLMIKRENTNSIIGKIQTFIPITFYNNT